MNFNGQIKDLLLSRGVRLGQMRVFTELFQEECLVDEEWY